MAQILLVEDSPSNAMLYRSYLETSGHDVAVAETGAAAEDLANAQTFDLMVLDLGLPDMDGLDVLKALGGAVGAPPTIVLTGSGSVRRAVDAMREGAIDFLVKPCSLDKLLASVSDCLDRRRSSDEETPDGDAEPAAETAAKKGKAESTTDKRHKRGPSGFLGQSPVMSNVFGLIEAAAGSTASAFITGETGTGKELCATAIHNLGDRRNGPFVALNCAAIPAELMESEIFGHRKGAFTGAVDNREGAASQADGGTLFLDELCEMDLSLQSKLLRFIQTGTYRRVGDTQDRAADIRFVCATNRDPLAEVAAGRFREDLYYRLYVVPIHMPPLRQRGTDIAMLARRFLQDFASLEKKRFTDFTADAQAVITAYGWPGNVRQLENAIRTTCVLHDGELVDRSMLPPAITAGVGAVVPPPAAEAAAAVVAEGEVPAGAADPAVAAAAEGSLGEEGRTALLVRPLVELEMMAIDTAIAHFNGNVTQAARALKISTSTIYRKQQAWESRTKE